MIEHQRAQKRLRTKALCFAEPFRATIVPTLLCPRFSEDAVLLRTVCSAISPGKETDLFCGRLHGRAGAKQWYPMLPGYLAVGEVVATGSKVKHLAVGDRALTGNLTHGFQRQYCPAWAGHAAHFVVGMESNPHWGGKRAVLIPPAVPDEAAVLALLAGVALRGLRRARLAPKDVVCVIGQGLLGQCVVQLATHLGARRVITVDPHRSRLALSDNGKHVVQVCGRVTGRKTTASIYEASGGNGPDLVIETSGSAKALIGALSVVLDGGRVHALGSYLTPVGLDVHSTISMRNLSLSSSAGESPAETAECLDLVRRGALDLRRFTAAQCFFDQAPKAYEASVEKRDKLTTLIKW